MAYFQQNESRRRPVEPSEEELNELLWDDEEADEDPEEEAEEEVLTGEELEQYQKHRLRMLFGAGNLAGILTGCVLILVLIMLLLSMYNFVLKDLSHSFSLIQVKF